MSLRRTAPLLLCAFLLVALGAWLLLGRGGDEHSVLASKVAARQAALGECMRQRAEEMKGEAERECPGAPESIEDLTRIGESVTARLGSSDARGDLRRG